MASSSASSSATPDFSLALSHTLSVLSYTLEGQVSITDGGPGPESEGQGHQCCDCVIWREGRESSRRSLETLGSGSLLFCSQEALIQDKWRDALEKPGIADRTCAVVVDEAHCISKWYVLPN